jgi:hypothetical protein
VHKNRAKRQSGHPRHHVPRLVTSGAGRDLGDRYDAGSLLITSQVPIDHWHDIVGNPTLAEDETKRPFVGFAESWGGSGGASIPRWNFFKLGGPRVA